MMPLLNLSSNSIGTLGGEALGKALSYNTTISHLDISNNEIGDEGAMAFADALQVNNILSTLLMAGCSIGATSMIALYTVLQSNNAIEIFDVSNNMLRTSSLSQTLIHDVTTHLGRTLQTNYGLKTMYLGKLGITDWVMCDFLANSIFDNQNLVTLDLSCNKISRDGGVALCKALNNHASLNNLKLSCCAIQDEGAEGIAKLLEVNRKIRT